MKRHFQRLFEYDTWANQRIIDAVQQLTSPDERCMKLLSHIFAAQEIWLGRISGNPSTIIPFPERSLQESIAAFEKMAKSWKGYLLSSSEADFDRIVSYKNTRGDSFETAIKDILTHVINHSTYHRAQIVSTLKGKIEKLPVTDFIAFVRK